jgi:hypothetical protein
LPVRCMTMAAMDSQDYWQFSIGLALVVLAVMLA